METKNKTPMTPFDQLISNQNLQMMKLLLPYTAPQTQRFLAVYVKFSELKYTLDFFQSFKKELHAQDFEKNLVSPMEILQEIRPYLPQQTSETLDTLLNMLSMMELFENFRENFDDADGTGSGFDPMSMMKAMLTPEQQSMVDMYSSMLTPDEENENNSEKGEDSND